MVIDLQISAAVPAPGLLPQYRPPLALGGVNPCAIIPLPAWYVVNALALSRKGLHPAYHRKGRRTSIAVLTPLWEANRLHQSVYPSPAR